MSITDPNETKELTTEQLFNQMSKSINSNDYETLDELVGKAVEEEEEVVTTHEEEVVPEVVEAKPDTVADVETKTEEKVEEVQKVAEPSDWTANLPAEAQEELKRLRLAEQRLKSEQGRTPYLQRRVAELEKQLSRENQSQPKLASKDSSTGSSTAKELEEALAQIGEVDPVTAKAMNLLREEARGSIKKTQTILEQRDEEALLAREFEKLTKQIPQAPQVFELPEWQEWKQEQTPGVRNLAESMLADEVVFAMNKFAADMQQRYPERVGKQPAAQVVKEEKVEPKTEVIDTKAQAIEEQRTRRLAATTPTSAAPVADPTKGEPTDPKALFSQFYSQIRKKDHLDKR